MPSYDYNLFVHIHGSVETDEEIENANDLVDFIFSSGVEGECEVLDASINPPIYASVGYIERTDKEEED